MELYQIVGWVVAFFVFGIGVNLKKLFNTELKENLWNIINVVAITLLLFQFSFEYSITFLSVCITGILIGNVKYAN